ncbi:hypothetical protein P0W64_12840 [Tsukamurella sp. 8F]|uniref:hypothetical protein n=1 Tax=unclassified Tsukamurella TaxID=2633480 RepID=UPI0023B8E44E|nr:MULTISPECIES: hypothetical protein [unclassified Tsukamurella]MDF0530366.1 hypothetical protein [Tsukamurella sp. 8J]MDF0587663.1 hypothetical protein [Tsukamurella sp. 8F]
MTSLLALLIRGNAIVRIDPATARVERLTPDAGDAPDGIVVVDGVVYWTTMGAPIVDPDVAGEAGRDYSPRNGGLHALALGGASAEPRDVLPAGAITTGKQLATDGARLYWSDREGFRVSSCRLDGSDPADHIVNAGHGKLDECVGVAVDPDGGWLYWTQKGPVKGGRGRILRAPLAVPEDPYGRTDIEVLWDGLPEPIDLEIAGRDLYWTDRGAEPDGNTLNRAPVPLPGESGRRPEILARGFREAIGLAVDDTNSVAYVSDLGGSIRAVPLADWAGAERTIVTFEGPVSGIVVTDAF